MSVSRLTAAPLPGPGGPVVSHWLSLATGMGLPVVWATEVARNLALPADPVATPATVPGSIRGAVYGPARSTASLFHISLYAENDPKPMRSLPLDRERGYRFQNLPDGTYWLEVSALASTAIRVSPAGQWVEVQQGQVAVQDLLLD
ncbi:MAG: hypothetical protein D6722_02560 [Bacteroidetes bacterium]|nr:MAG: hypothetical protein D6722_02560 [Bacteroidota bacterium]